ncbi:MAG: hypothetical protein H8D67_14915 [Deltaproteobacteria bacterium]|nr:hypothetical protein [Deltaproteobacteria bacterium]MBL7146357.1 hypothetical protein [Phycisphaerae bacterium]
MTRKKLFAFAILMMLIAHGCAEDITPSEIFEKVKAAYKSMDTYKAQGTITANIDTGGTETNIETSFSIILKKPNLYLISWTKKFIAMAGMSQAGAVWSDGDQPYLYIGGTNAYSKMGSDELALAGATGISGGAAFTIPSLFLSVFKNQHDPFSRLKDPQIEKTEKVGKEDCYVISGSSSISKKETFWVSKKSYLIKKYYRSLEFPEGGRQMPEMTDEQLEEAIKGMGQEVTEESKQKMREMMKRSKDVLNTSHMKGSSTELHAEISSPKMNNKDFQFALPAGTVLKESLFGGVLGGSR